MGTNGQLIHPDSVVITNTREDTMPHEVFQFSDGWYTIDGFSPFHEITCFNQCISDSAFTRTYYVYIGNGDTDTMEVYFAERSEEPEAFYNGRSGEVPEDRADSTGLGYTSYWFRKTIK